MKLFYGLLLLCFYSQVSLAQHSFQVIVKDQNTQAPLIGVSVLIPELQLGGATNYNGKASITNIPEGTYTLKIQYLGYQTQSFRQVIPTVQTTPLTIYLKENEEKMEEVIVTSTRSSRTIEDIPTRVEVIAGEELAEKGNMKPGNIRMLLNESTGIQTQQTSATSFNSGIRIQGLDGKYTQLLRDGLPLYSGYSGGLSLMQIAPLDLKQVEVIKGASSTLYGGGAIAGLVNLISKTPEGKRSLDFMANGTSALGLDLSGFYSEKFGTIGTTVFASYNKGTAYDPADINLTAIPEFDRFTLNPKFFVYLNDLEMNVGFNYVTEDRLGGNMAYIEGDANSGYFENNTTDRLSTQLNAAYTLSEQSSLQLKNSISFFDRTITIPDYAFSGNQVSSFSEINYHRKTESTDWIFGLNLWTEDFTHEPFQNEENLSFQNTTVGAFAQNTWNMAEKWTLETGLRTDYQSDYGWFVLPKFSLLYEPTELLTLRTGGGLGYKTPSIFTEDSERLQFQHIQPIAINDTKAEESLGANMDINYKWPLKSTLGVTTNLMLFYTRIDDPLMLTPANNNTYEFTQPNGYLHTQGIEANMKLKYQNWKLFVGYTYADVDQHYNNTRTPYTLVSKHRLNNVLMYEKHENFWIGLEGYYYSPQKLSDGATGKSYWIVGIMTEKQFGDHFSIFLNFENFTDTRQTRFDTIYTGSIDNPQFRDIYAPVDGFVINGGFKIKL
ncbi:iron complex outermembrane recepter protein [Pustulibacterium marinum]|uniref:Iron complex outermembrane recepter protein n=1 Tax=Pustulibacterium marinum TaxID=1224947 RepID=A0A1I7IN89_9FLAO|nr:TonB-dependent receptor [Pustulibacterium marinum]SFU74387.1 iron complex outermembrane recepter protein [Pustulibacterium marinum]